MNMAALHVHCCLKFPRFVSFTPPPQNQNPMISSFRNLTRISLPNFPNHILSDQPRSISFPVPCDHCRQYLFPSRSSSFSSVPENLPSFNQNSEESTKNLEFLPQKKSTKMPCDFLDHFSLLSKLLKICDVPIKFFNNLLYGENKSRDVSLQAADSIFRAIGDRWTVPWTGETILQVMLLWIASFWLVGSWMMPFAAHIAGFSKESLTYRGQALYSLLTDVTEGLAGIAILHRCLSRFRPLPPGWFKFSLRGKWYLDVALGCLMFPLVNRLSQFNLDILPLLPSTPITLSSVEQSILARDPVAMGLYVVVVSVCAPIWEEIVFRGFLLPSLTKYMPVWCSILVSSVVFALAHFNIQRMLPLIFLGVVMGALFARTRNLVPSMLLHSLWNAFVFLDLMK